MSIYISSAKSADGIEKYRLPSREILNIIWQDLTQAKRQKKTKGKGKGKERGRVRTSDHTPASHTVMQSWPSQRWAEAGLGPAQSLSRALIRVPLLSCWVHATCLLCIPFPQVREHGVHSVIIHLKGMQEALKQVWRQRPFLRSWNLPEGPGIQTPLRIYVRKKAKPMPVKWFMKFGFGWYLSIKPSLHFLLFGQPYGGSEYPTKIPAQS